MAPILSKKSKPESLTFRWDPELFAELRALASETGRSLNETGEILMRWAVQEARRDLERQAARTASEKKEEPTEPD